MEGGRRLYLELVEMTVVVLVVVVVKVVQVMEIAGTGRVRRNCRWGRRGRRRRRRTSECRSVRPCRTGTRKAINLSFSDARLYGRGSQRRNGNPARGTTSAAAAATTTMGRCACECDGGRGRRYEYRTIWMLEQEADRPCARLAGGLGVGWRCCRRDARWVVALRLVWMTWTLCEAPPSKVAHKYFQRSSHKVHSSRTKVLVSTRFPPPPPPPPSPHSKYTDGGSIEEVQLPVHDT